MWTAGYHGDDGDIYENTDEAVRSTEQTFGVGDTVGCGIDYEAEEYFFTCNGKVVGQSACQSLPP